MYRTLLGEAGFKRGLQLYFERHDGQAVTTDDFLAAMADANQVNLEQLRLWYSQAGTPVLDVSGEYDDAAQEFRLHVRQSCPETPGQRDKEPFLIPFQVGLVAPDGDDMTLQLAGETEKTAQTQTLRVTTFEQTFDFVNVPFEPVPSLLRNFSAPVKVHYPYSREQLAFLFANDNDPFNRWDAGQRLATDVILEMVTDFEDGWKPEFPEVFQSAFRSALGDSQADPAFAALALTLPAETELAEAMVVADPIAIHVVREQLREALAATSSDELRQVMVAMQDHQAYSVDPPAIGRRALKNLCLTYLTLLDDVAIHRNCFNQFADADNMTDRLTALTCLVHQRLPNWEDALAAFYHNFQDDPLVIDKWFTLQAMAPGVKTLEAVVTLMEHPAFTMRNPNRVRSLIGAFAHGNPSGFHDLSGAGYAFLADRVLQLDATNPQLAARMLGPLSRWQRYAPGHQELMCQQLERIWNHKPLSNDVGEIVEKSLQHR